MADGGSEDDDKVRKAIVHFYNKGMTLPFMVCY